MKKIFYTASLVLAAVFSGPAFAVNLNFAGKTYKSDAAAVPAPVKSVKRTPPRRMPVKKWTVMVFVNAKNNLEMAGLYNVNQMENVGSTKDMNIVVELGRMNGQAGDTGLDGNWTGSRRFYITKDTDTEVIHSPVVQQDAAVDMGDYNRAADFVKWAKKNYPAQKYMLVLWDHGSGWLDPQQTTKPETAGKGISFDDETNNYIRTRQIGQILKDAGGVDVLAFDACLMQMGEVAFEVKDNARVVVGSEETVPGMGYPYSIFLGELAKNPDYGAEDLGAVTVEAFKMFYDSLNKSGAQLSAIRTSQLAGFGTKMSEFAALAETVNDTDTLKAARDGVMRYDMVGKDSDPNMTISFYGDVYSYAGLVAANLKATGDKAAALKAKAADLQNFIDKTLVIDSKASGKNRIGRDLSESHGISIYLPPAETRIAQAKLEGIFEGKYTDFQFDKTTNWHDFVTYLYGVK